MSASLYALHRLRRNKLRTDAGDIWVARVEKRKGALVNDGKKFQPGRATESVRTPGSSGAVR